MWFQKWLHLTFDILHDRNGAAEINAWIGSHWLPLKYIPPWPIGRRSYGVVCSALDREMNKKVPGKSVC
ncbi:unnamed protein product [Brassica rapa subsp. trilocularis]